MSERNERDSEPELLLLSEAEEARLAALLRHAFQPSEIEPARHERLLSAALEDPLAEASPEELAESERLRRALEGQGDHRDLHLARALSAAFSPRLEQPLSEPELRRKSSPKRAGRVIAYRFTGVATALALAAALLLRLSPEKSAPPAPDLATLALAQSRSTAGFFRADSAGAPSERIDRIASVRSRELRDNRYALWGVR